MSIKLNFGIQNAAFSALLALFAPFAAADTCTWNGSNGSGAVPANWADCTAGNGEVPGTPGFADTVVINAGQVNYPSVLGTSIVYGNLNWNGGSIVTSDGSGRIEVQGTTNILTGNVALAAFQFKTSQLNLSRKITITAPNVQTSCDPLENIYSNAELCVIDAAFTGAGAAIETNGKRVFFGNSALPKTIANSLTLTNTTLLHAAQARTVLASGASLNSDIPIDLDAGTLESDGNASINTPLLRVFGGTLLPNGVGAVQLQVNGDLLIESAGTLDLSHLRTINVAGSAEFSGAIINATTTGFSGTTDLVSAAAIVSNLTVGSKLPLSHGLQFTSTQLQLEPYGGADCQWLGGNSDFQTPSNWSCGIIPGPSDAAIILSGTPSISAPTTVGRLLIGSGLVVNSGLTVGDYLVWDAGDISGSGDLTNSTAGRFGDAARSRQLSIPFTNAGSLLVMGPQGGWVQNAVFSNAGSISFEKGAHVSNNTGLGNFSNTGNWMMASGAQLALAQSWNQTSSGFTSIGVSSIFRLPLVGNSQGDLRSKPSGSVVYDTASSGTVSGMPSNYEFSELQVLGTVTLDAEKLIADRIIVQDGTLNLKANMQFSVFDLRLFDARLNLQSAITLQLLSQMTGSNITGAFNLTVDQFTQIFSAGNQVNANLTTTDLYVIDDAVINIATTKTITATNTYVYDFVSPSLMQITGQGTFIPGFMRINSGAELSIGISTVFAVNDDLVLETGSKLSRAILGSINLTGGTVRGFGTIAAFGGVNNTGATIAPGLANGLSSKLANRITIEGNYTQSGSGNFKAWITGQKLPVAGVNFGFLAVTGAADLSGGSIETIASGFPQGSYALVSAATGTGIPTLNNAAGFAGFALTRSAGNIIYAPAGAGSTVSVGDLTVVEGNAGITTANFILTRSDNLTAFDVSYLTADGTAQAGTDYTTASGITSFTVGGPLTQSVSVTVSSESIVEANETFVMNLTGVNNITGMTTIGDGQGLATINNDDQATITISPITQAEGNTGIAPMNFSVTLSNPIQGAISFTASTQDSTATVANNDYQARSNVPLSFANASTTPQPLAIQIVGDTTVESDEQFLVVLAGLVLPPNIALASVSFANTSTTGGILNDDIAAASTTTTLSIAPSPIAANAIYTLTATVQANLGVPTGTLTVTSAATSESCTITNLVPLTANSASGSCTLSSAIPGGRSFVANYLPTGAFVASSSAATSQVVTGTIGTLQISSSPTQTVTGQAYQVSVALSALIPGSPAPTGNIRITQLPTSVVSNGVMSGGNATINVSSGQAVVKGLLVEYTDPTGVYPNSSFIGTHVVNKADTGLQASISPASAVAGQTVQANFSVSVLQPGSGAPTGSVSVSDGVNGCSATLPATSCMVSFQTTGQRSVQFSYAGDGNYNGRNTVVDYLVGAGADLAIGVRNARAFVPPNSATQWQIVLSNPSANLVSGISVNSALASNTSTQSWRCVANGSNACPSGTGTPQSGPINTLISLAPSSSLTFLVDANMTALEGSTTITAQLSPPANTVDPNPGNNSATDIDVVGPYADGFEDE